MACYHPSRVNVSRKSAVRYGARISDLVTVPCGHCLGCRTDQARSWAIRLQHESEWPPRPSWFTTLTYDPEHVPENGSLDLSDLKRFLRRIRRRTSAAVSFYACGEYGDVTFRPHFHAVLYGPHLLDRDHHTTRSGAPVFTSDTLNDAWSKGFVEATGLTYAAARYVAGYVRKKVRQRDDPDHYTRVDPETGELVELQPEVARMSLRPAIGKRWIEKYWEDVYPRDFVVVDGHPVKPPRYYDRWLDQHRPDIMYDVRRQRLEDAIEIGDEKLIMKEKIHRSRVDLFESRAAV